MEEDPLRRWMAWELHRLNEAAVVQPVPLSDLLRAKDPKAPTRGGGWHAFDPDALGRLAPLVPLNLHHRLRLPVTFYEPHDTQGEGYFEDATAVEAVIALEAATTTPRGGRLWMSIPLAMRLRERFPTVFQSMAA